MPPRDHDVQVLVRRSRGVLDKEPCMRCPHCGCQTFEVERPILIWQTQIIRMTDADGTYVEEDEELGDTIEQHPWEYARCANCGQGVDVEPLRRATLQRTD